MLCVSFFGSMRLTTLSVDPHASPTTMFDSTNCASRRAAVSATRSSRSASLTFSGTGTTCAAEALVDESFELLAVRVR